MVNHHMAPPFEEDMFGSLLPGIFRSQIQEKHQGNFSRNGMGQPGSLLMATC